MHSKYLHNGIVWRIYKYTEPIVFFGLAVTLQICYCYLSMKGVCECTCVIIQWLLRETCRAVIMTLSMYSYILISDRDQEV